MNTDFQCEKRLKELNPGYLEITRNTAVVALTFLDRYTAYFPGYTDHSSNHSMQVLDFCNRLIGDQIAMLNEDELFILIMACYLHDCGMGIAEADYRALRDKVVSPGYLEAHPGISVTEIIRNFHQNFSGELILRYRDFFEIPSDEHVFAIAQVSRGHRKEDLFDPELYPADFRMPDGNTVCLPYLASLIRLADELDIASDRNVLVDYSEFFAFVDYRKHFAIRHMEMEPDRFVLSIRLDEQDQALVETVRSSVRKLQETLDLCREVAEKRTLFRICQKTVEVDWI